MVYIRLTYLYQCKSITRRAYTAGFKNAFGIQSAITQKMMAISFKNCAIFFNGGKPCDTIDLSMLHVRLADVGPEHDASITRNDAQTMWNANGDATSCNLTT